MDPLRQRDADLDKYDPLSRTPTRDPVTGLPVAREGQTDVAGPSVDAGRDSGPDLTKEYTGPAVLSRSYSVERPTLPENVKFRPSAGISSAYDSGLSAGAVGANGATTAQHLYGAVLNFGLEGRHYWRHDILQLFYSGNLTRYTPTSNYNGTNHNFTLSWTHQVGRHVKLTLSNSTAHYSSSYTLTNPVLSSDLTIANIDLATAPNIQIFDNSVTQINGSVNATYQKSSRLSFDFNGAQFYTLRDGRGLVNVSGWQAGNDVAYRLSKKMTTGAYYSHSRYKYSHQVGDTSINTFGAIYSYAFNPRLELHVRVGLSLMENLGITSVSLDPVIAALLGQDSTAVQQYSKFRAGDISGSISRVLRGGRSVHFAYNRGATPGNGVFVSSTQQVYDAGYSALFLRRYRVNVGVGRVQMLSLTQTVGQYSNENVHFSVSRTLARNLQSDLGFDYRHFEVSQSPVLKNQYRVTIGFTWSNSDFPRKIF